MSIKLGDKVVDKYNGYAGWVHGIADYLTGCRQYLISPRTLDKDGKPQDGVWTDEMRCELVTEEPAIPKNTQGGPSTVEAAGLRRD